MDEFQHGDTVVIEFTWGFAKGVLINVEGRRTWLEVASMPPVSHLIRHFDGRLHDYVLEIRPLASNLV